MMDEPSTVLSIAPQNIVVIHPGSLNVRIGRASDLDPVSELHVIARRRKVGGLSHRDEILPSLVPKNRELTELLEDVRLQVSHTVQSCLQSDGRRRYATPPQQIAAFNRRSEPTKVEVPSTNNLNGVGKWIKPEGDIVVGDDVLKLDPSLDFNVHFPYRRGDFNVHGGPGGSVSAIIADLEAIWGHLLTVKLGLPKSQRKQCRAVLVIPDVYNRQYLKELMTLLLSDLGFGGCFLLQDHVAATFGAGLGVACVVDVGDQKTSVSCVEDGISHRNTRIRMEYGGGDITHIFHWLLLKCAFPYKTCDSRIHLDAMLLHQLKQDFCHVNLDVCGSHEKSFAIQKVNDAIHQYTLMLGDECIVAPLSLFYPELFSMTGTKTSVAQKRSAGDSEDPFDDHFIRETGRKGAKENLETAGGTDISAVGDLPGGDDDIVVDTLEGGAGTISAGEFEISPGKILGLDQAVLQSIDRCPSEDMKRKMYNCILVVGGGMKFTGIAAYLQNRLHLQVPFAYRSDQTDIVLTPKDTDPQLTAWKGASILSCLESSHELWITPDEWKRIGVKILRERAPFMW